MSRSGKNTVSNKNALAQIQAHEKECAIRYQNIERRLQEGSKRFDRLEFLILISFRFRSGS